MKNKQDTFIKDKIKEFKEEYKKTYRGILSEETLEKENYWFENFVRQALTELSELHKKDLEELEKESDELSNKCKEFEKQVLVAWEGGKKEVLKDLKDEIEKLEGNIKLGKNIDGIPVGTSYLKKLEVLQLINNKLNK